MTVVSTIHRAQPPELAAIEHTNAEPAALQARAMVDRIRAEHFAAWRQVSAAQASRRLYAPLAPFFYNYARRAVVAAFNLGIAYRATV